MKAPARLLPLLLAAALSACTSSPTSTLGELPRTPQASIQELLAKAAQAEPADAALLRLSAADQSYKRNDLMQAQAILEQVDISSLPPAQQMFASTLDAELALANNNPQKALDALSHPAFARLAELPPPQQIRAQLAKAQALEALQRPLDAARERVFIASLLPGDQATANHEAIWKLVSSEPSVNPAVAGPNETDLAGWLSLAAAVQRAGTIGLQQRAIEEWIATHPGHPAAQMLPEPLVKLRQLADRPLEHIALLLPLNGQLAGVAQALRDGFLAGYYQAATTGQTPPRVEVYDSNQIGSLDAFYEQAKARGVQLVVGPLEKDLVRQLAERSDLPLTTLALNYSDADQQVPAELFQFGLAAEDEAREVARRAWADGHRSAIALAPRGDWGSRVLAAFQQAWRDQGGTLVAAEALAEPVELADQIANLVQPSAGSAEGVPSRRQDIDFLFLAATPQQAQQVKPTLVFQYAGDLPVYATSHLNAASGDVRQYQDLEGIRFAETPWLLDEQATLRQRVTQQWPAAGGSLGRLYAMGADAFELARRIPQLVALPNSEIEGLTGTLTLTPGQRVARALPWAEFRGGQVVPLPATQ